MRRDAPTGDGPSGTARSEAGDRTAPPRPFDKESIAVVVPTRNSSATLRNCLESIRAQSHPCTLIVVDNGSADATRSIALDLADIVISAGPERSAQRNAGAAATSAGIVAFIDSDMTLPPTIVAEAVNAIASGAVAVVIPELTVGDGFWADVRAYERTFYEGSHAIEAPRFFRRDVFMSVGGFDEAMTGGEDWDLGIRTAHAGLHTRTETPLLHHEGRVRYLDACRKKAYYAPGVALFLAKHKSAGFSVMSRRPWLKSPRSLASKLGVGLLLLKAGELSAVLMAVVRHRFGRHLVLPVRSAPDDTPEPR